jgi:hypothetical protein
MVVDRGHAKVVATKNLPSALLHLQQYPSFLRLNDDIGDVSELEIRKQQVRKDYEDRIAAIIEPELTPNRTCFVAETARFLQSTQAESIGRQGKVLLPKKQ